MLGSERMIVGARPCHVHDLTKRRTHCCMVVAIPCTQQAVQCPRAVFSVTRQCASVCMPHSFFLFSHTATRNSAMSAVVRPTDDMHAAKAHRTRAAMHAIAHTMTRTSDSAAHPSSPDQPTAAISNRSHVHARPPRLSVYVCVLVHAPWKQEKNRARLLNSHLTFRAVRFIASYSQPRSVRNIITHVRPMYACVPSS